MVPGVKLNAIAAACSFSAMQRPDRMPSIVIQAIGRKKPSSMMKLLLAASCLLCSECGASAAADGGTDVNTLCCTSGLVLRASKQAVSSIPVVFRLGVSLFFEACVVASRCCMRTNQHSAV